MPMLQDDQLRDLCQSVAQFSEAAMRRAIDEARDPDKAQQVIERLRQETADRAHADERFAAVGLCVVLGEAKVEAAISILLELATDPTLETLYEAAAYALLRMGTPAFQAVMAFIPTAGGPQRAIAYGLLHAADDGPEKIKTQVADFCVHRAQVESALRNETNGDYDPDIAAMMTLAVLRDPRGTQLLRQRRFTAQPDREREVIDDLLEILDGKDKLRYRFDWHTDWPEHCKAWATACQKRAELTAAKSAFEQAMPVLASLAAEFAASAFARDVDPYWESGLAVTIGGWLSGAVRAERLDPAKPQPDRLRRVLVEWMPRELPFDARYFQEFPKLLLAYIQFLHATGRVADPQPLIDVVKDAAKKLPDLAFDPNRWSKTKLVFMSGFAEGFDMSTPEGIDAYGRHLEERLRQSPARPAGHNRKVDDGPEDYIAPLWRDEERVGRNDPCPCGSGRKHKKCCGRR